MPLLMMTQSPLILLTKTLARGHANGPVNGILDGGDKNLARASEGDVGICLKMVTENTDLRIGVGTAVRLPEGDAP